MKVAIVGAGRIGSAFGFHLGTAGHEVTLVARGRRLQELEDAGGMIETTQGQRARTRVAGSLDQSIPWDLVLVTVLSTQVHSLLPTLRACRATTVMFMFNTFGDLAPLRDCVGPQRARFGFPNMIAMLESGRLRNVVDGTGMVTTTDSPEWAAAFQRAGLPAEVQPDMQSYLRSHVAFVVPLMLAGLYVHPQGGRIRWRQALLLARASAEGLRLVAATGHRVMPPFVAFLGWLPVCIHALLLRWSSGAAAVRDLGQFGPGEVRSLIDAMVAESPEHTATLQALRP